MPSGAIRARLGASFMRRTARPLESLPVHLHTQAASDGGNTLRPCDGMRELHKIRFAGKYAMMFHALLAPLCASGIGAAVVVAAQPTPVNAAVPDGAVIARSNARDSRSDNLEQTLVDLEKKSWQAWQQRDPRFFENFLARDHVEVGVAGVIDKQAVLTGVASPVCVVDTYAVDRFKLTVLAADLALLTYHASQQTRCAGRPVPSPVWVSSLYIQRDGHWLNALYQQTTATE